MSNQQSSIEFEVLDWSLAVSFRAWCRSFNAGLKAFFPATLIFAASAGLVPVPAHAQFTTWTATAQAPAAKLYHTSTLLQSGKVLVAGGGGNVMETDLYDPASGSWAAGGNLAFCQWEHTANLLPNGKVIIAGGTDPCVSAAIFLKKTQIYNPATNTWAASTDMGQARWKHASVLLPNGKVLVMGARTQRAALRISAPARSLIPRLEHGRRPAA
jgi:hypothetical protein